MRFVKMHGCGNDYVYVDCFRQKAPANPAALSRRISDRHFGVGSDGLILICPSERADARMRMFNADGSEAEMCGNGIRCVAKYLYDHGLVRKNPLRIETGRGVLELQLHLAHDKVERVTVDMGEPIFDPAQIPTTFSGQPPCQVPLQLDAATYEITVLSMGNPHCVLYVAELQDEFVHGLGPRIEHHPAFPKRINVEFVKVLNPDEIRLRVWERGSGETLACGTGACAACVAGVLTGRTRRRILAHLLGGDLELEWSATNNHVYMTGPAVEVFSGEWPDSEIPDH